MAIRNPRWSRDELIVALDFYLRHQKFIPNNTSTKIKELSQFLNSLQLKIGGDLPDKFRNNNGVYMKLMNFRRFDPNHKSRGLERGNKDEEVVWDLYATKPYELKQVADGIRGLVLSADALQPLPNEDDEEEAIEGKLLTRTHKYHERDARIVKLKKEHVLDEQGALSCEVCVFDFQKKYGKRGDGYIECHHTKPVSELKPEDSTKLSDLSLVCSNCHRMIHRKRPWFSIDQLQQVILVERK